VVVRARQVDAVQDCELAPENGLGEGLLIDPVGKRLMHANVLDRSGAHIVRAMLKHDRGARWRRNSRRSAAGGCPLLFQLEHLSEPDGVERHIGVWSTTATVLTMTPWALLRTASRIESL